MSDLDLLTFTLADLRWRVARIQPERYASQEEALAAIPKGSESEFLVVRDLATAKK